MASAEQSASIDEGCPIHPIRNGSPNWGEFVTDRAGSSPCVSSFDRLSVWESLRK